MLTNILNRIATLPQWAQALLLVAPTLVLIVVSLVLALRLDLGSVPLWVFLLALGVSAIIVLWLVPKWQVRNLPVEDTEDRHKKFEFENEARKIIAQILGGAFILVGLFFTAQQLYVAQDVQTVAREAQLDAQEAQITERLTRATEQLASDRLEIRIGGIYALARLARDSEDDFGSIVNILQTFVRENAPREKAEEEFPSKTLYSDPSGLVYPAPPADIEAALGSLIDLSFERDQGIHLDLHGANVEGAAFGTTGGSRANYQSTYLFNTNLQYASLIGVNLPKGDFTDSNLRGANLSRADLSGVSLQSAQLNHANFFGVDLIGADLRNAQLYEAGLANVDLDSADFQGAQLKRAILCRVNLQGAKNLTQSQLNATKGGEEVRLPIGLEPPPAWGETDDYCQ